MRIRRQHNFTIEDARTRVDVLARDLERQFMLRSEWEGHRLVFSGSGASGDIVIYEEHVELKVRLGFALKLMLPAIRSAIEHTLDEQIGAQD